MNDPTGISDIAEPDTSDGARPQQAAAVAAAGVPFRIVPTGEWGAAPPKHPIAPAGKPHEIIFHHTEGHHAELDHKPGDTLDEAKAFARQIQQDHFSRGWSDSGHNFLVTRSGHILEGRHGSLGAIKAGVMVVSAHCVGHNGQPGIEHEHIGPESMTAIQREASLFLHELICRKTGIDPHQVHPHRQFNNTDCPGVLLGALPQFRIDLAKRLEK